MLVDSDGLPVMSETENTARGIDVAKVAMKHAIYKAWLAKHVYHRRPVLGFLIIPEFVAASSLSFSRESDTVWIKSG